MIGLLHPGAMGAAVGAALVGNGHSVGWASAGRSAETVARAHAAGLVDLTSADVLFTDCSIVLSVCPPQVALEVAESFRGYAGVYVDANAISPARAQMIATHIVGGGGEYVDGAIIGPPTPLTPAASIHRSAKPEPASATRLTPETTSDNRLTPETTSDTRLYLAGERAQLVADLFAQSPLAARVIGPGLTAPSALKMAFAAWSKGSAALLLASRALAEHYDVGDLLTEQWNENLPGLTARIEQSAKPTLEKAWRWSFELAEVAAAFAAAGLPPDFGNGAAQLFDRLPQPSPDQPTPAQPTPAQPTPARTTPARTTPEQTDAASLALILSLILKPH